MLVHAAQRGYPEAADEDSKTMKKPNKSVDAVAERIGELRAQLARKIASNIGSGEKLITQVPGLLLTRRTAPSAPASATYEPSLAVVAQGRKRATLAGTTFIFDESRYLLTSLDLPVICNVIEASEKVPYLCFVLKLEMPVIRELLGREEIQAPEQPADSPAMATGETTAELLDACCRLVDLLNTPHDIPFLSGLIQREIIYRILRGPEGVRLRAIATLGEQSHRTAKAVAWVRANYAKPLRLDDLAKTAGMGVSTLHHHFRALTAMSPLQYQKQLRLHAARERMLIDGLDAASAAFEVGYESATQFNREYSRFFGQPPMRDVRNLRAPGALALESVSNRPSAI
jgi:AraC-like DNA-binding protein